MIPKSKRNDRTVKPDIRYYVPSWADPFPPNYNLEVIHRGIPETPFEIKKNKIKFVIGRADDCDGVLEDVMISKHHIMLFYGINGTSDTRIWAIDLDSQNKSKINKNILEPQQIYPLNDQDVIQLSDNEYTLIIHYPETNSQKSPLITNITDGINDDINVTITEKVNLKTNFDEFKKLTPKELVISYFERKGIEPNFQVESDDSHKNKFHAFAELPIYDENGSEIFAHAYSDDRVTIVDDLYQVCYDIITKHDNIFESETFKERKKRELAENDYYEDEDDVYFDRSGQIESKRDDRLSRLKIGEKSSGFETFSSMNVKLDLIRKDIQNIQEKVQSLRKELSTNEEDDELDRYMKTLQDQIDDNVRVRYEEQLQKLKQEEQSILQVLPRLAPLKIMESSGDKSGGLTGTGTSSKESSSDVPVGLVETEPQQKSESKRKVKPKKESHKKTKVVESSVSKYCDEDEEMNWIPPENQSGDGFTDLNKKFGY